MKEGFAVRIIVSLQVHIPLLTPSLNLLFNMLSNLFYLIVIIYSFLNFHLLLMLPTPPGYKSYYIYLYSLIQFIETYILPLFLVKSSTLDNLLKSNLLNLHIITQAIKVSNLIYNLELVIEIIITVNLLFINVLGFNALNTVIKGDLLLIIIIIIVYLLLRKSLLYHLI